MPAVGGGGDLCSEQFSLMRRPGVLETQSENSHRVTENL